MGEATPAKVLIVEADAIRRELLVNLLRMAGFQVIASGCGEHALLRLREFGRRIDWLFTPISLPGLVDGWILADEYRAHHPNRPVLHGCGPGAATASRAGDPAPLEIVAALKRLAGREAGGERPRRRPQIPLPTARPKPGRKRATG